MGKLLTLFATLAVYYGGAGWYALIVPVYGLCISFLGVVHGVTYGVVRTRAAAFEVLKEHVNGNRA